MNRQPTRTGKTTPSTLSRKPPPLNPAFSLRKLGCGGRWMEGAATVGCIGSSAAQRRVLLPSRRLSTSDPCGVAVHTGPGYCAPRTGPRRRLRPAISRNCSRARGCGNIPTDTMSELKQTTDDGRTEPDYSSIEVPADADLADLHYMQRRAMLYDIVMAAGHPEAVSGRQLAERFDVDPSTISRDLDRINEYLRQNVTGRRDLESHAVYQRAVTGLLSEGEYLKAAKAQRWYDEFLDGRVRILEFRKRLDRLDSIADGRGGA